MKALIPFPTATNSAGLQISNRCKEGMHYEKAASTYTCTCACTYTCEYTKIYTYTCTYTFTYLYVYLLAMPIHIVTHILILIFECIRIHVRMHKHQPPQKHEHAYLQTHKALSEAGTFAAVYPYPGAWLCSLHKVEALSNRRGRGPIIRNCFGSCIENPKEEGVLFSWWKKEGCGSGFLLALASF